jgi:hypothetical protein
MLFKGVGSPQHGVPVRTGWLEAAQVAARRKSTILAETARHGAFARLLRVCLVASFGTVLILLASTPIAPDAPNAFTVQTERAQALMNGLREALEIPDDVQVVAVLANPLVFSVEPADRAKSHYVLSMEFGFLRQLDDRELRAALAHELGHVWIYTHFPFLQTERLANTIGQRVVDRGSFEKVYTKLWAYEGTQGVPMDELLGASFE